MSFEQAASRNGILDRGPGGGKQGQWDDTGSDRELKAELNVRDDKAGVAAAERKRCLESGGVGQADAPESVQVFRSSMIYTWVVGVWVGGVGRRRRADTVARAYGVRTERASAGKWPTTGSEARFGGIGLLTGEGTGRDRAEKAPDARESMHRRSGANMVDRPSPDETPCYGTREKKSTSPSDAGYRASTRDVPTMAVYYDEYGDYAYETAPAHQHDFFYHSDPSYGNGGYDSATTAYYEAHGDDTIYEEVCPEDGLDYASQSVDYEQEEDAGCMVTAYGETGYWEEYQRRRYAIIYGDDCAEEVVEPETSWVDTELAFDTAVPATPHIYPPALDEYTDEAVEDSSGEEDEAHAWEAMWELGPRIGENEFAWAEAMEEWRERIQPDEQGVATDLDIDDAALDEFFPHRVLAEHVEGSHVVDSTPQTLEELQALYDRGEIPEEDRVESCELEDQRLLAAGHVWDEELSEYVHPNKMDSLVEYDDAEDGLGSANPNLDTAYTVNPVAELQPVSTAPIPIQLPAARHSSTRRDLRRTSKPKFPSMSWTSKINGRRAFVPTPRGFRPIRRRPPVPPPRPPPRSTTSYRSHIALSRHRTDTVLIPRAPEPPDILGAVISTSTVLARTTIPALVPTNRVPKPPNIPSVPAARLQHLSVSAERRRNAQHRLAKKGKG
ncbi:hypothetical protein DFH09DRAFT_1069523 [Mycena vulgaris]|nr:hypothetical protein DFH09DRAFT_1069523 [Mycena vulgaris]